LLCHAQAGIVDLMTGSGVKGATPLTERERAVIDFERSWWREHLDTKKQAAIGHALGISASRYYALLVRLIERQEAFHYDPLVIARLRRRRNERVRAELLGESPSSHRRP
jgi:hypothetical protein